MNQVICIGNLTKDPEVRYTPNKMAVARFNLALNRGKDKNGSDKGADYPSCVAFGKTAEVIEKWVKKGDKICVEGHITTGSYEGKDGKKVYTTEVTVDRLEMLGGKKEKSESPVSGFEALDEEIPF